MLLERLAIAGLVAMYLVLVYNNRMYGGLVGRTMLMVTVRNSWASGDVSNTVSKIVPGNANHQYGGLVGS